LNYFQHHIETFYHKTYLTSFKQQLSFEENIFNWMNKAKLNNFFRYKCFYDFHLSVCFRLSPIVSLKWMKSVKNDCFLLIPWSINERRRYLSIFCRSRANLKSLVSFSRWIEVKESGLWNNNFFYYKFREIFVFVSHRLLLDVSFKNVICCFFGWMPNDLQRKVVKTSSIKNLKL